MRLQNRYSEFRIEAVINDLNDLEVFNTDKKTVQLIGSIGQLPIIANMPQSYDILKHLVPSMFGGGWYWSEYYFYYYFSLKNVVWDRSIDVCSYDLEVLKDTMYHTIKGADEYILVEIK